MTDEIKQKDEQARGVLGVPFSGLVRSSCWMRGPLTSVEAVYTASPCNSPWLKPKKSIYKMNSVGSKRVVPLFPIMVCSEVENR